MIPLSEQAVVPSSPVGSGRAGGAAIAFPRLRNRIRRAVLPSSLAGMTVDERDVAIARGLLTGSGAAVGAVELYETTFARWNTADEAVAFGSGRTAFAACLAALGVGPGDEVILPAYTCVVVPHAILTAGATPVYCDIELETYGPDIASVESRLTSRTRAILVQHLYGLVAQDLDAILGIARQRGIFVIEDCAHSAGATLRGRRVGTFGHAAFYSSQHSKVFSTVHGGIAVAQDSGHVRRLRSFRETLPSPPGAETRQLLETLISKFRLHRADARAIHALAFRLGGAPRTHLGADGFTSEAPQRMADQLALVGLEQLSKIDGYNQIRRRRAQRWTHWANGAGYRVPRVIEDSVPVFLRYPLLVADSMKSRPRELEDRCGQRVGTWFVSHIHPVESQLVGFTHANTAVAKCINLPTLQAEDRVPDNERVENQAIT